MDGKAQYCRSSPSVWMWPGKRIAKIKYFEGGGLVKSKEYGYNLESGETSGSIFGLPNFYFLQNAAYPGITAPIYDQYGSLPGSPLTNLQGNGVGYSKVTEYFGDLLINSGKVKNDFTVYHDAGNYYKFPYHDPVDNEWLRGMLLLSKVFEKSPTGYILKKSIANTYVYGGGNAFPWSLMTPFIPQDPGFAYEITRRRFYVPLIKLVADPNDPMGYSFIVYYKTGGTVDLASTIVTEYSTLGNLISETNYSYDYDKHYQLAKSEEMNSKGESVITCILYPSSLLTPSAAVQGLLNAHRLASNITTEVIVRSPQGQDLSKIVKHKVFTDFGNNLIMPGKDQVFYKGVAGVEIEYKNAYLVNPVISAFKATNMITEQGFRTR